MRQYLLKIMLLFSIVITITSCSNLSIQSDWDTSVDFSKFNTFHILQNEDPSLNRLINQRIKTALVAQLTSKGLKQVDTQEDADLAFGYAITTEQRTTYHTVHNSMGASSSFRHSGVHFRGTVGGSRTTEHRFTVGTLVIAAYQLSDKELVWEGSASGVVNPSQNPDASKELINDAVHQILKRFPHQTTPAS